MQYFLAVTGKQGDDLVDQLARCEGQGEDHIGAYIVADGSIWACDHQDGEIPIDLADILADALPIGPHRSGI